MSQLSISQLPMSWKQYKILIVSSMEQIIGAGLSTVVGVMIPMIVLLDHPELGATMQGIVGAMGLIGIAVGSAIIGKLSDREGYLKWFRISPLLILIGSAIVYFFPDIPGLLVGLFITGFGVGGGYALDSSYISELMPVKWKLFMVGVAKGTSALGFLGAAIICFLILKEDPSPRLWNAMIIIIGALGLLTLLVRIRWAESPHWLMLKGRTADARKATEFFFGKNVVPDAVAPAPTQEEVSWGSMFRGQRLRQVILTGIPWACEGLGVYGFGVFLPVLIMALGLSPAHSEGISSVIHSIGVTSVVNFFILPGFVLGLWVVMRWSHVRMLAGGFVACSVGLLMLLFAYIFKLPAWISILGFIIFEVFLNAGPHLVTFILPSQVFPVEIRGTGSGIAAMLGKVGAVLGVILMPMLLKLGGMVLVLVFSFLIQILGAWITVHYGKTLVKKFETDKTA